MSKLYSKYLEQKALNPNILYLFKSGIFYMALNDDANRLSDALSLKVTNITEKIYKCCFPVNKSDYYFKTLESLNIAYKIIDPSQNVVLNYAEYKNNEKFSNIIENLLKLDLNKVSFQDAYIILTDTVHDLKQIINNEANC
jgi:DNA mismatch repair ATPase MutS